MVLTGLAFQLLVLVPLKFMGVGSLQKNHSDWYFVTKQLSPIDDEYSLTLELNEEIRGHYLVIRQLIAVDASLRERMDESKRLLRLTSVQRIPLILSEPIEGWSKFSGRTSLKNGGLFSGERNRLTISGSLSVDRKTISNLTVTFSGWVRRYLWGDLTFSAKALSVELEDSPR